MVNGEEKGRKCGQIFEHISVCEVKSTFYNLLMLRTTNVQYCIICTYNISVSADTATEAESKEKHGVWDLIAGVDYNLTLCLLKFRPQHIYCTMGNPMPKSTSTLCNNRFHTPVRNFGFGLRNSTCFRCNVYSSLTRCVPKRKFWTMRPLNVDASS